MKWVRGGIRTLVGGKPPERVFEYARRGLRGAPAGAEPIRPVGFVLGLEDGLTHVANVDQLV